MTPAYQPDNVFARILRGEIPNQTIYEDDRVLAFHDLHAAAPVHALVIPKGPYVSFDDFTKQASAETIAYFFDRVRHVAGLLGVAASGYRLVTNHGKDASQTVPHFHVHLLGGRALGGLLPDDLTAR